jgi:pimeloyl-ACP methyl ester carboxylesterase
MPTEHNIPVHRRALPTGITLEVADTVPAAGGKAAGTVLLLHGFPDLWHTWRHQIPALAAAGYRVIAPNQRGYGRSDKPEGVAAYDIDKLAADAAALAKAEGNGPLTIIGHDWGGVIAYWAAAMHPAAFSKVVILNAPHPGVIRSYMLRHPGQIFRSLYAGFFQLPYLPERLLSVRGFRRMRRAMKRSARSNAFTPDDWPKYEEAWAQPGALTAMINYYRALFRRSEHSLRRRVEQPTLVLWGRRDVFEQFGLAHASVRMCTYGRVRVIDTATHWAHREEPAIVNTTLLRFLEDPRMVSPQGL